ncbi:phosphate signaling complex protein PhoU [Proteinivorax hydrogeniformans]|uniref:Phosphate-specific transport system accessory protein PhoU n=1 Tax=Proteinivorax hydrogeniformans TaxID=1826727 RepID=A0AAU8HWA5_9FIRM
MVARHGFHKELKDLIEELLFMGNLVEESISKAVIALKNQNLELARQVIEGDEKIDNLELEIESTCLALIARQQPMAKDLRKIATVLKIITDLERIADHAVDIAKICVKIDQKPLIKPLVDIPHMALLTQKMVNKALESFIKEDVKLAHEVCNDDDHIDEHHKQILRELLTYMMEDPKNIDQATQLMFVSSYLERIGDHSTNICEWLIYLVTGERKELNK